MMKNASKVVGIVGLGYVGLPLAESFSKKFKTIGFDIDHKKIDYLKENGDEDIEFTKDPSSLREADFVIIAVPTPLKKSKEPDLSYVESAAEVVGKNLKKGSIVVLESTVYPGVTEDIMAPILEKESGMMCGADFKVGYSPERVNPGDEEHTIDKITKIVSGMDKETCEELSALYGAITTTFEAQDIKTAEAAKVIENIQRDLNIALVNEFTLIFQLMRLDTQAVLDAASTKWNFHQYTPGLVGGHCLPVDPYYLVHKSRELGYHPQVILAGRSVNDYMPKYVAEIAIKGLNEVGKVIKNSKILIMGLTYKRNVPDTRESPVKGIIKELKEYKIDVYGYDPLLSLEEMEQFGLFYLKDQIYDCIILNIPHKEFFDTNKMNLNKFTSENTVVIDVKGIFEQFKEHNHYKKL
jgi:UDPglucose 6-dehydrogenase/UDP-N-acetyl-D-galactosamine dehydrogenase